jgi:hypothetical protein
MSRRPAQPCYPEPGQPEGCFPDDARTPSPFACWLASGLDRLASNPANREPAARKRPARSQRRTGPKR